MYGIYPSRRLSADSLSFSKDGQWVAYTAYPESTLWRSKADGSQRLQLTYPPMIALLPNWSPDRRQLAFYELVPGHDAKLRTVSVDGGTPTEQIPDDPEEKFDAAWSPTVQRFSSAIRPQITIAPFNCWIRTPTSDPRCPDQQVSTPHAGLPTGATSPP